MAKDIEEFLRMAAARRRDPQARPPASQPPSNPNAPPRQKKPPAKPVPIVSDSEVEVIPSRRQSVAKHVESHLDTRRLSKRAEKLGERVGRADDELEARLHQKFDHDVGTLGKPQTDSAQEPDSSRPLASLLAQFASPQSVRQAILMNEILKRPDWD